MELKDYLWALRKRWFVVLLSAMLGVLVAAVVTMLTPRVYEARTELFVAPEVGTSTSELVQGASFVLDRVKSYVRVIDRDLVLGPVIEELGLDSTVPELSEDVSASVVAETVVVVVAARSGSAQEAAEIANEVAAQFVQVAPTLEPQRTDQGGVVRITVTDPARVPSAPISPRPMVNLALGLLVGLALGVSGAVIRQGLDRRVQSEAGVREVSEAPVIGHVPNDDGDSRHPLVTGSGQRSVWAEALRQVRTNLQFLGLSNDGHSYVVTSSIPGEGKTVTSINLALTLAEAGQRVCFVEADLRRPTASAYLHLVGSVGLTDILIGAAERDDVTQPYLGMMDVILAGAIPPNPSDLLSSDRMGQLLEELETQYDVVIIDAPPLLPVTDSVILAKRCSGAIVIVSLGRKAVTSNELADALDTMSTVDARVLGIVLNRVPRRGPHGRGHAYMTYAEPTPELELRRTRSHRTSRPMQGADQNRAVRHG